MNRSSYLQRIGIDDEVEVSRLSLERLHEAHMRRVPFENLDIGRGVRIVTEEESILDKIVRRRRGGFCYELNGAFAALLRAEGFRVDLLSACVARPDGSFGPEFDHLTLVVHLDEPQLADVGFGDSFLRPIPLRDGVESTDESGRYRLVHDSNRWALSQRKGDEWVTQYRFSLLPHLLSDFSMMCEFHQTSPESHFTRKKICSLATATGRVTLSGNRLIRSEHGLRTESTIDPDDEARVLAEEFGIVL